MNYLKTEQSCRQVYISFITSCTHFREHKDKFSADWSSVNAGFLSTANHIINISVHESNEALDTEQGGSGERFIRWMNAFKGLLICKSHLWSKNSIQTSKSATDCIDKSCSSTLMHCGSLWGINSSKLTEIFNFSEKWLDIYHQQSSHVNGEVIIDSLSCKSLGQSV